jgi:hypothetical protein
MTAPVSPDDYRRAALASGEKSLRTGRRLVGVYWPMPGERELWSADCFAFDHVGGISPIKVKVRKRSAKRRSR